MPMYEFMEWFLYEQAEPFGDRRGDVQAATVAVTLANIHRPSNAKPHSIIDFIPKWEEPEPQPRQPMNAEQQLEIMLAIQQAQNARVNP